MNRESPIPFCEHPGFIPDYELEQIAKVARCIKPNSSFVEVGTLLGRSARAWYYNSDATVNVTLVDNFIFDYEDKDIDWLYGNKQLVRTAIETSKQQNTLFGAFQELCKDFIQDVNPIEIYCASSLEMGKPYDFVFLDASHSNDGLTFLMKNFITDDNIVSGHDYCPDSHPNVVRQCDAARTMFGRDLMVIKDTSLWFLVPPGSYLADRFSDEQIEFQLKT